MKRNKNTVSIILLHSYKKAGQKSYQESCFPKHKLNRKFLTFTFSHKSIFILSMYEIAICSSVNMFSGLTHSLFNHPGVKDVYL